MIEYTFVIIKPDAIERRLVGKIIGKLEALGELIWIGTRNKGCEWVKQHYAGNPHLTEEMIDFMSDWLIGIVLSGDDIVARVRQIVGSAVNPEPGTIRFDYGAKGFRNLIHAADLKEKAIIEEALFMEAPNEQKNS